MKTLSSRVLLATFAVASLGFALPHAVTAQQPLPSYARPATSSTEETIRGRITTVNGTYMEVADDRGFTDRINLHQGTIINPTGIRLEPGMTVSVMGHPNGRVFIANEIDTPYHYSEPYYGYPYPYYPYPYYYGPNFSLGFGFGPHHWR